MSAEIDEETREILDCFLAESREAIEELEVLLLAFEDSQDSTNAPIDSMFRIFHSIKGSAGYLDFGLVEKVTHQAETVLQKVRDGETVLTRKLVDCLCLVLDFLNGRLDAIAEAFTDGGEEEQGARLVAQLQSFLVAAPPAPPPLPKTPLLRRLLCLQPRKRRRRRCGLRGWSRRLLLLRRWCWRRGEGWWSRRQRSRRRTERRGAGRVAGAAATGAMRGKRRFGWMSTS